MPLTPDNAYHKAQLLRLLSAIVDNKALSHTLYFKGGTCSTLLGYLDRFSVDLDFDVQNVLSVEELRGEFHIAFKKSGFILKDESKVALDFLVGYKNKPNKRSTIKVDAIGTYEDYNVYKPQYIQEIDRYVQCQTIETMFAHKLIATKARYIKNKTIAARDLYDLHYFFSQGYSYSREIIETSTKKKVHEYLAELVLFIKGNITDVHIREDLNVLLPYKEFSQMRKTLKQEVLFYLENEHKKVKST